MVGKGQNTNAPTISYLPRRHGGGAGGGGGPSREYDPTSSITRMTDITDLVIDDEDDSYNIDDSDAVLNSINSSGRRRSLSTGDIEDVKIKNSRRKQRRISSISHDGGCSSRMLMTWQQVLIITSLVLVIIASSLAIFYASYSMISPPASSQGQEGKE